MKTSRKLWAVVIVGLVVVVGLLVGVKAGQIVTMVHASEKMAPPPMAVSSATAQATEWTPTRGAVGTLVAVRGVTLGAELPGLVREITFESGSFVKKGAPLVRLDTSTEQAQLEASQAEATLAKVNAERARVLRRNDSMSQADLDSAEARARGAAATVASLEATIAKKTIRAPFDGRVAIRQVNLGQVLAAGTAIASLQSITPIYADFWLPQQALADLRVGMETRLRTDVFPKAGWEGSVTTVNPEVDVATRNVRVRATFPNADGRLRPGMFGNVDVLSPEKHQVLAIPSTAVVYAPFGDSVFAVEERKDPEGKSSLIAHQKFVRLGERRGDLVAAVSGLQAGETIVSSGAFKLRNNVPVVVHNELAPNVEVAPKPVDQ